MKSASDGGSLQSGLQVLHVHVLLAVPLGAGYMAEPGTGQHEGRTAIRETAHHTGAAGHFHTAFPPAVPLDIAVSKEILLSLGTLSDIPGSSGEITAVVTAAAPLPLLVALVPGRLGQLLYLFHCFFHAASDYSL